MPTKNWIKVTISLFAGGLLLVGLFSGDSISGTVLQWTSILTSLVTLALLAFDHFLWRTTLLQKILVRNGHQNINGTWKGTLEYDRDSKGKPGKTHIYLSIDQSYSMVDVRGYVSSSSSHTVTARVNKYGSNRTILEYVYRTQPPEGMQDDNRITDGFAKLTLVGLPVTQLEGSYFTNRDGGTGRIKLYAWSDTKSDSYDQAKKLKYIIRK